LEAVVFTDAPVANDEAIINTFNMSLNSSAGNHRAER
jgi:hypothetical protein